MSLLEKLLKQKKTPKTYELNENRDKINIDSINKDEELKHFQERREVMSGEMINQENVTQDLLKGYFDQAFFETKIDDKGSMFIQDRFRVFIDINNKKKCVSFSVYFNLKEGCPFKDALEYANTINKELLQIKAIANEKTLTIEHDMWIEGGLSAKNMFSSYRSFVSQVPAAIGKDRNKVLL
ncbi:YbjN domain-containing protein [Thermodesulfobacteriota bacterium]